MDGTIAMPNAKKKFSRFAPQNAQKVPERTTVQDTQPQEQPSVPQHIATSDHLTSEATIPVSILQRALPQRFADMQSDTTAAVYS